VLKDEIDNLELKLQREFDAKVAPAKLVIEEATREFDEGRAHIQWLRKRLGEGERGKLAVAATVASSRSPTKEGDSNAPDTLASGVRVAVKVLRSFTADDIAEWLRKQLPNVLGEGDRRNAITIALSRLKAKGAIKVTKAGLRGQAQVYEFINGEEAT
jgi:hypothetical protein